MLLYIVHNYINTGQVSLQPVSLYTSPNNHPSEQTEQRLQTGNK